MSAAADPWFTMLSQYNEALGFELDTFMEKCYDKFTKHDGKVYIAKDTLITLLKNELDVSIEKATLTKKLNKINMIDKSRNTLTTNNYVLLPGFVKPTAEKIEEQKVAEEANSQIDELQQSFIDNLKYVKGLFTSGPLVEILNATSDMTMWSTKAYDYRKAHETMFSSFRVFEAYFTIVLDAVEPIYHLVEKNKAQRAIVRRDRTPSNAAVPKLTEVERQIAETRAAEMAEEQRKQEELERLTNAANIEYVNNLNGIIQSVWGGDANLRNTVLATAPEELEYEELLLIQKEWNALSRIYESAKNYADFRGVNYRKYEKSFQSKKYIHDMEEAKLRAIEEAKENEVKERRRATREAARKVIAQKREEKRLEQQKKFMISRNGYYANFNSPMGYYETGTSFKKMFYDPDTNRMYYRGDPHQLDDRERVYIGEIYDNDMLVWDITSPSIIWKNSDTFEKEQKPLSKEQLFAQAVKDLMLDEVRRTVKSELASLKNDGDSEGSLEVDERIAELEEDNEQLATKLAVEKDKKQNYKRQLKL